jgi:hypothetical protein
MELNNCFGSKMQLGEDEQMSDGAEPPLDRAEPPLDGAGQLHLEVKLQLDGDERMLEGVEWPLD